MNPTGRTYLLGAVYDGVPGDPDNPYGTQVQFNDGDGVFAIGEIGMHGDESGYWKVGVGGWYGTARFEDFNAVARERNSGVYVIGERSLLRDDDSGRDLGAFVQIGFADGERNPIDEYVGAGLSLKAPLPGREDDVAGIAVARAANGGRFRRAVPGAEAAETVIEASYLIALRPWLSLQPDLQYIVDPGADPALDDALVVGLRIQVSL